jgi:molybdopterin-binding protein
MTGGSVSEPRALDLRLLAALASDPNLVRACASIGITRDRGNYRLQRLARTAGGPVVRTVRGGPGAGSTSLTPLGRAVLARGRGPVLAEDDPPGPGAESTLLTGTWIGGRAPGLMLPNGLRLTTGFSAPPGATVEVAIDPEVVVLARRRFLSSARNTLEGRVTGVHGRDRARRTVTVDVRGIAIRVGVTPDSVRTLGLRPGARVVLYLKAMAIRPLAVRPPRRAGGSGRPRGR